PRPAGGGCGGPVAGAAATLRLVAPARGRLLAILGVVVDVGVDRPRRIVAVTREALLPACDICALLRERALATSLRRLLLGLAFGLLYPGRAFVRLGTLAFGTD